MGRDGRDGRLTGVQWRRWFVGVGGAGVFKAVNGVYDGECKDGKFDGKGVDVLHRRKK